MDRRQVLRAAAAAATVPWLGSPRPAPAQAPAAPADDGLTKKIAFKTYDEVTIQGVLYKSKKGGQSPCVMILHSFGQDPNKGDFRGLATSLAEAGYNVLRFDFRGHGQSTLINANKFWTDPINAAYMPKLAKKKPPKNKLELADFKDIPKYYPRLADDVMAARVALDQLNDNGEVNTATVYLIGATDAITPGLLYMTAEWSRPQKMPPLYGSAGLPPLAPLKGGLLAGAGAAGMDVAGAVWLSPAKYAAVPERDIQLWVQYAPEMRERTPMLFLYGDQDQAAHKASKFFRNEVLAAAVPGAQLPQQQLTQLRAVKNTKLVGAQLLGQQLETEKLILDYLNALEKERQNQIRVPNRSYTYPPAINLPLYNVCKYVER